MATKKTRSATKRQRRVPDLRSPVPDGVDWNAKWQELVADGDDEGARMLEDLVPRLFAAPYVQGHSKNEDGEDEVVEIRVPTAADLLDILRDRANDRRLRADLRPVLAIDLSTAVAVLDGWRACADWAARLSGMAATAAMALVLTDSRPTDGQEPRSAALQWAFKFRDVTAALSPILLDRGLDDVPVHRLLQDVDELLEGRAVDLDAHVREVDALVRAGRARVQHPKRRSERVTRPRVRHGNAQPMLPRLGDSHHRVLQALQAVDAEGLQAGDLKVPGLTVAKTKWRRLNDLRQHGRAELVPGTKRWRAIKTGAK